MIWENATKEDITNFFHTANNFHHFLKFTHLLSKQEITFVDTTVYERKGSQNPEYWISKPTPNQRRRINTSTEHHATQTQSFVDS